MTKAIVISRTGGPEVLEAADIEVGLPGPGQLRIRQTAVGVNFHDVYVRSGLYQGVLSFPGIPGVEAVGVVEAVGPGVEGFAEGDRVAYASSRYGAYAGVRLLDAALAVSVPAGVDDAVAATLMVKGITAALLVTEVGRVQAGDTVLVHAAAGGAGRLLCQWAHHLGATVIGTVGSTAKIEVARRAGCSHVIDYSREDFVAAVLRVTHGRGARVVFDSVGRQTMQGSLAALAPCGHLVNFGQSSGAPAPITLAELGARSGTLSRPIVFHYMRERAALEHLAGAVFRAVAEGWLRVDTPRAYALNEAASAHADLEARVAMGPPVLIP